MWKETLAEQAVPLALAGLITVVFPILLITNWLIEAGVAKEAIKAGLAQDSHGNWVKPAPK